MSYVINSEDENKNLIKNLSHKISHQISNHNRHYHYWTDSQNKEIFFFFVYINKS